MHYMTTPIEIKELKFSNQVTNINYGENIKLELETKPIFASNKEIIWSSSDTSLVSVDQNGNIKVIKNTDGSATITATTIDGSKKATVKVNVKKAVVKVTGVKINNSTSGTLYLNKKTTPTIQLSHSVSPSNATNKNVTWSSSNTSIAIVDSTGKITPKSIGSVTIAVKTIDGNYQASYKLNVKQKVIVVITASAGQRMQDHFKEYLSKNGNYYYSNGKIKNPSDTKTGIPGNGSLLYVYKSGSGFDFQYEKGLDTAIQTLNSKCGSKKSYIELSVFFTLTGNSVKNYTCDNIVTNKDNLYTITAQKYSNAIAKIKESGYTNVQGFIISHSPLNTKEAINTYKRTDFAYSHKAEACQSGYRSAWKYWLSNRKMNQILVNGNYGLTFINNYENFVILNSEGIDINSIIKGTYKPKPEVLKPKFTWLRDYTTEDGLHFDGPTAKIYTQLAFDTANR